MASTEDRREMILAYIHETILTQIANANPPCFAYRNVGDIDPINPETQEPQLPGLILLDGNETPVVSTKGHNVGGQGLLATVMLLEPQIYVALMPRTANKGVGPELSLWRQRIIHAINQDDNLRGLLGGNGEMSYDGLESDMHANGPMVGQEAMKFSFSYTLDPRRL